MRPTILLTCSLGLCLGGPGLLPAAETADADTTVVAGGDSTFSDWKSCRDAIREAEGAGRHQQVIALITDQAFTLAEDDGDRRWLHGMLGEAHRDAGDVAAALAALEAFITAQPDAGKDQADEARDCFRSAERQGDVAEMQAALAIYRALPEIDAHRAAEMQLVIATAPRALDELLVRLESATELDAVDARTLARIRAEDDWPYHDPGKAAAAWLRVITMQPEDLGAMEGAIANLARAGAFDQALGLYRERSVGLDPQDRARLLRELTPTLVRAERQVEVVELIAALGTGLEPLPAARLQGEALERAGLPTEAETRYREALRLALETGDREQVDDIADDLVDLLRDDERYQDAIAIIDGLLVVGEQASVQQLRWQLERARLQERADRG